MYAPVGPYLPPQQIGNIGSVQVPSQAALQQTAADFQMQVRQFSAAVQRNEVSAFSGMIDKFYRDCLPSLKFCMSWGPVQNPNFMGDFIKGAFATRNVRLLTDCMECIYEHLRQEKVGFETYFVDMFPKEASEELLKWTSLVQYEHYVKGEMIKVSHFLFFLSNYAIRMDMEKYDEVIKAPVTSLGAIPRIEYFTSLITLALKNCNFIVIQKSLSLTTGFEQVPLMRQKMMPILALAHHARGVKDKPFYHSEHVLWKVQGMLNGFSANRPLLLSEYNQIEHELLLEYFKVAKDEEYVTIFELLLYGTDQRKDLFAQTCRWEINMRNLQRFIPLEHGIKFNG